MMLIVLVCFVGSFSALVMLFSVVVVVVCCVVLSRRSSIVGGKKKIREGKKSERNRCQKASVAR